MDFNTLEREALALAVDERAQLARDLLASLERLSDQKLEVLWQVEASARAKQLLSGEVEGIAADEVFREAEGLLPGERRAPFRSCSRSASEGPRLLAWAHITTYSS